MCVCVCLCVDPVSWSKDYVQSWIKARAKDWSSWYTWHDWNGRRPWSLDHAYLLLPRKWRWGSTHWLSFWDPGDNQHGRKEVVYFIKGPGEVHRHFVNFVILLHVRGRLSSTFRRIEFHIIVVFCTSIVGRNLLLSTRWFITTFYSDVPNDLATTLGTIIIIFIIRPYYYYYYYHYHYYYYYYYYYYHHHYYQHQHHYYDYYYRGDASTVRESLLHFCSW